jgi:6-phosphogluconolactonase
MVGARSHDSVKFGAALLARRLVVIVYVSNAGVRPEKQVTYDPGTAEIRVLAMDDTSGDLRLVQSAPVPGIAGPMAVGPNHDVVYVAVRSEPWRVITFGIHPTTGQLTQQSVAPLPGNTCYLSVDRSGRYLLSASMQDNCVSTHRLNSDGSVSESAFRTSVPTAHAVVCDPDNRFVIVPGHLGDRILLFRFDEGTGAIMENSPPAVPSRPGSHPRHVRFHPTGRHVYVLNEGDGTLCVYAYSRTSGVLSELQRADTVPAGAERVAAADLQVTPDGRYVYVTDRPSSAIYAFRIGVDTGRVEPIQVFTTVKGPRGIAIHPNGRWLLSAGQDANQLAVHSIDQQTGLLTDHGRTPMGEVPHWIEMIDLP